MPLLDALRKKDRLNEAATHEPPQPVPEFTFLRTTTFTQEIIEPPSHPPGSQGPSPAREPTHRRFFSRSSRQPSPANPGQTRELAEGPAISSSHGEHRLSSRLHLSSRSRSRGASTATSPNVPDNLPSISSDGADKDDVEAAWEKRATLLAQGHTVRSRSVSASSGVHAPNRHSHISDAAGDVTIQEAIRLHDNGELTASTNMFEKLAEPEGENNALAQVLFGLALRHGWGVEANPARAIEYLSAAASNAAQIEDLALSEGQRKGGAAKGELTLAIYELGNSFRHGWGVAADAVAARQYYETAANLGDYDAMAEVANCYLEGIGGKKDKWKAAQYLRRAEKEGGRKEVGGSWIWKSKYDEDHGEAKKSKK